VKRSIFKNYFAESKKKTLGEEFFTESFSFALGEEFLHGALRREPKVWLSPKSITLGEGFVSLVYTKFSKGVFASIVQVDRLMKQIYVYIE
jgi:hypothetical protein